jgi:hypothetical protein
MLFKNSVRTSKRTPHLTITKINWLTLFKEIIAVYSLNHTKLIKMQIFYLLKCVVYSYHSALHCSRERGGKEIMPTYFSGLFKESSVVHIVV